MFRGRGARDGKKKRAPVNRSPVAPTPDLPASSQVAAERKQAGTGERPHLRKKVKPSKKGERIAEEMRRYGFELMRFNGGGHMVFAKPGTSGELITASTPRCPDMAVKRVRSAVRRLLRNNTRAETNI